MSFNVQAVALIVWGLTASDLEFMVLGFRVGVWVKS